MRGASLILTGAMCVVPFLQPRHFSPIRTFYDEWLAFAIGLTALGLATLGRSSSRLRIPTASVFLGLFATILFVRAFGGFAAYPQLPLLWACYALFAALLVILGCDLVTRFGQARVCDALAAFLLAGALANSIAGILQVTGIPPPVDAYISYLNGSRAIGNIGQPNLYANYLALGGASLAYLYARGTVRPSLAIVACALLLPAAALAASRSYLLYLGYFVILGWIALRHYENGFGRRICIAAATLGIAGSQLQWLVPAVLNASGILIERASPPDWTATVDASTGLRLIVWQLAWELFTAAPWLGVGPGEFSGAGFAHGLPIELGAELIWTSPHNLLLQLLAETGLVGTLPIAVGLLIWAVRTKRDFLSGQSPAMWWIAACVGVELLHALVEFPFWYAHFLAITALLMGVGSSAGTGISIMALPVKLVLAGCSLAGALGLVSTIYDYTRFDLAIPASDGRSLAPPSRALADRTTLRELRSGILAPRIELMLFLALPLDQEDVADKISIGARVLRVWPSSHVVSRQSIFLALAGQNEAAILLLSQGLKRSRSQRELIANIISQAPPAARSVLQPLLASALPRSPG